LCYLEFRCADEETLLNWLCTEVLDHDQYPERLRELVVNSLIHEISLKADKAPRLMNLKK